MDITDYESQFIIYAGMTSLCPGYAQEMQPFKKFPIVGKNNFDRDAKLSSFLYFSLTESDDYSTTACGTFIELDRDDPAQLTSEVLITFPADNTALEGTEVLSLRLENTQSVVTSAGNIFFKDTSIQICDTTGNHSEQISTKCTDSISTIYI